MLRIAQVEPQASLLQELGRRTDKRGSVFSALFPHTVLSYQNAAGVRYAPPRRARSSA
jgi:hypothetical protein